jgi:Tol biopolymer transport system component
VWYDATGKLLGPIGGPGSVLMPAISPDEKVVAFTRPTAGNNNIWLRDLVRARDTLFTPRGANTAPTWSPKGERLAFTSGIPFGALYQKAADGSGEAELLVSAVNARTDQWSRDGRFIVFTRVDPKTRLDLWVLPMGEGAAANRNPVKFQDTEFNESQGQLSPDSQWMAYTSDESGQREVYVRPFPSGEGKWTISTAGGEQPRWRGDGKKLFYLDANGKVTAVEVNGVRAPKPLFDAGVPVALFESHIFGSANNVYDVFQYDVTADGKRFLVIVNAAGAVSAPPLTVVVNWVTGAKR